MCTQASSLPRPPDHLVGMNDEWMNDDPKMFSDFYENLQKWSLDRKNLPYFGKSAKNFFLPEKNPTSSLKKNGILVQIPDG